MGPALLDFQHLFYSGLSSVGINFNEKYLPASWSFRSIFPFLSVWIPEYVAPLSGEILRNHCYTYLLGVPYFFLIEYCLSLS